MKTQIENLKPKVGTVYSYGWGIMKQYFLPLFLLLLITGLASFPAAILSDAFKFNGPQFHNIEGFKLMLNDNLMQNFAGIVLIKIFVIAYSLFIMDPINYGAKYVNLKAVRHEKFDIKEVFDGFKNYLNVVLASLLASSIVIIGFVFLVIPGIVFACRLVFVPYLVMDKKLDPVKAVEESWRITKGYGWKIFWMAILAFFIGVAGFICLIVGLIFSIIWISSAFAVMYQAVIQERGEYVTLNIENGIEQTA